MKLLEFFYELETETFENFDSIFKFYLLLRNLLLGRNFILQFSVYVSIQAKILLPVEHELVSLIHALSATHCSEEASYLVLRTLLGERFMPTRATREALADALSPNKKQRLLLSALSQDLQAALDRFDIYRRLNRIIRHGRENKLGLYTRVDLSPLVKQIGAQILITFHKFSLKIA